MSACLTCQCLHSRSYRYLSPSLPVSTCLLLCLHACHTSVNFPGASVLLPACLTLPVCQPYQCLLSKSLYSPPNQPVFSCLPLCLHVCYTSYFLRASILLPACITLHVCQMVCLFYTILNCNIYVNMSQLSCSEGFFPQIELYGLIYYRYSSDTSVLHRHQLSVYWIRIAFTLRVEF